MAGAAGVDPILTGAAVFLGAATIAVPVFKRIGLGSVLGYLAAGMLIGPSTLGLVSDLETAAHFGEFGVVLLLFVIGLELRPSRLWRMRMEIFGLGLAQVALTALLLASTLYVVSTLSLAASIAIGAALALSSTAFAVQIMRDRGELTTSHGDRAFSILLFQDLAIVPLLGLVAFLSPGEAGNAAPWWQQLGMAVGAVAVVIVFGRYGLKPMFRAIALSHTEEIFAAAALLVVVLASWLMQLAGLSMALGAFLAGVLLAESEYRHQLEADIEPFRSLFLGLFFMSVGMTVEWSVIAEYAWLILFGALVLYAGKSAFLFVLTRAARSSWADAVRISALLGQGGEFGFVILKLGTAGGLVSMEYSSIITSVVVLTMVLTPAAIMAADRLVRRHQQEHDAPEEGETADATHPVIIAGFGRFGQVVARIMALRGYEIVLIDNDPERIRIAETFGNKVFYGDLRRSDLLKLAGAGEAKAIFLCGDDKDAVAKALQKLRARLPNTPIFCRASDRFEQSRLEKLGASGVIREMYESAIALAEDALAKLGEGSAAEETIEEFRRRDLHLLHLQEEHGAHGGLEKMREQFSLEEDKKAAV